ncbi:MAG TPA: mandelate racemase/muconate lactonizing enzyme family protein [Candidatus Sulfotelmatobacter sp.]|nr:mandelate racemase/muconate lactonizing enzyme family protein [Candidatus Sulfotelmatobacter sp.]
MKIKDIQTTLLSVPLNPPIADSTHVLNHIQWVVVEIRTDEGLSGHSLMLTFDYGPELLRGIVDVELKKLLIGKDTGDIAALWQMCYAHCEYIGQTGLAAWGIAAIDIALWDLLGKKLGVPVCQLFGSNRKQVPVYGSGGWLSYNIEELQAEATSYVKRGFSMVKMKVGRPSIQEDVERVRAVRDAIGAEVSLMVDANQAWSAQQAISFARQVEDQDIFWFEEPVSKNDLDGYCQVAAKTNIPIATGEREFSLGTFREFLSRGAAAIVQPDALRIGGLSQALKVAHLADAFHRPVAPHFYKEIDVHLLAAVNNGLFLEYFSWLDDLLLHPLEVAHGMARVPTRPGMSLEFKPEAIREYKVG